MMNSLCGKDTAFICNNCKDKEEYFKKNAKSVKRE